MLNTQSLSLAMLLEIFLDDLQVSRIQTIFNNEAMYNFTNTSDEFPLNCSVRTDNLQDNYDHILDNFIIQD